MREFIGPVALVAQRIPQRFLEAIYGIQIKTRPIEEGGTGQPTADELLRAYAQARGFQTQGLGQPDESRAARYVLKDYVAGKLLFVSPPPGIDNAKAFNTELYDEHHLPEKRRAALVSKTEDMSIGGETMEADFVAIPAGPKSKRLDKGFFNDSGSGARTGKPFNYKYTEQGQAEEPDRILTGRKARTMVAKDNGIDPKDVQVVSSKKHFKGNPKGRGKRRTDTWDD